MLEVASHCSNCNAYHPGDQGAAESAPTGGTCRRKSPEIDSEGWGFWPRVEPEYWCDEHKPYNGEQCSSTPSESDSLADPGTTE